MGKVTFRWEETPETVELVNKLVEEEKKLAEEKKLTETELDELNYYLSLYEARFHC